MTKRRMAIAVAAFSLVAVLAAGAILAGLFVPREKPKNIASFTRELKERERVMPVLCFENPSFWGSDFAAYRIDGNSYTDLGLQVPTANSGVCPIEALEKFGGERKMLKTHGELLFYMDAYRFRGRDELYLYHSIEIFVFDRSQSRAGANELLVVIGDRETAIPMSEGEVFFNFVRRDYDGYSLYTVTPGESGDILKLYILDTNIYVKGPHEFARVAGAVSGTFPVYAEGNIAEVICENGQYAVSLQSLTGEEDLKIPEDMQILGLVDMKHGELCVVGLDGNEIVAKTMKLRGRMRGKHTEIHRGALPEMNLEKLSLKSGIYMYGNDVYFALSDGEKTFCLAYAACYTDIDGITSIWTVECDSSQAFWVRFVEYDLAQYFDFSPGVFESTANPRS